jgi:hypothetical protein
MAYTFDTLGYTKRLESAGIMRDQAEAHAEAARDFVMAELVTKTDLNDAIERQTLRLTIRLGALMVTGLAIIGFMLRLFVAA